MFKEESRTSKPRGIRELWRDLGPAIEGLGAELIDIERVKEHGSVFLRVTIDVPEGADLNACEKIHKSIAPTLEDVEYDYLEVASPGLDRPLKRLRDLQKNLGKRVEVRLFSPMNGQKIFFGTLIGCDDEENVQISLDGGETVTWARKQLALIKLDAQWDDEQTEVGD